MMDYEAEITVREDPDNAYKCLMPEKISRERSTLDIKKGKSGLIIRISAKDAVAFRATINAVTQVLAVCRKMRDIK
jgi:tRNA threonylcarbamoyladenosine modification (KEOPS) complex  Pcc1 subunit